MKWKRHRKDFGHIVKGGVLLGAGETVAGSMGSTVGAGTFAGFMPPIVAIKGAHIAMDAMGDLRQKKRKRR